MPSIMMNERDINNLFFFKCKYQSGGRAVKSGGGGGANPVAVVLHVNHQFCNISAGLVTLEVYWIDRQFNHAQFIYGKAIIRRGLH